jgi:hypothetical protein
MENTVRMHLITVATLAVMAFVIIGIPYLVGLAIDRLFNTDSSELALEKAFPRDPVATWMIGAVGLSLIGLFGGMIYVMYTDIFTYYTKP